MVDRITYTAMIEVPKGTTTGQVVTMLQDAMLVQSVAFCAPGALIDNSVHGIAGWGVQFVGTAQERERCSCGLENPGPEHCANFPLLCCDRAPVQSSPDPVNAEGLTRDEIWSLLYAIEVGFGREMGDSRGLLAEMRVKAPSAVSAVGMLWCDAKAKLRSALGSVREPGPNVTEEEFAAFLGGYEAVYDDKVDLARVRISYDEWKRR